MIHPSSGLLGFFAGVAFGLLLLGFVKWRKSH
jgi:hypothetical protein